MNTILEIVYAIGFLISIPLSFIRAKDQLKEERYCRGLSYEDDIKINVAFNFVCRIIFWPIYLSVTLFMLLIDIVLYLAEIVLLFIGEQIAKSEEFAAEE